MLAKVCFTCHFAIVLKLFKPRSLGKGPPPEDPNPQPWARPGQPRLYLFVLTSYHEHLQKYPHVERRVTVASMTLSCLYLCTASPLFLVGKLGYWPLVRHTVGRIGGRVAEGLRMRLWGQKGSGWCLCLFAVWPWAGSLTSLDFSLLMGKITVRRLPSWVAA